MREIEAADVAARMPSLLQEVERGETVAITRGGRTVARIVPEARSGRGNVAAAVESIQDLRRQTGRITVEELLSAREDGRRF